MDYRDDLKILCRKKGFSCSCYLYLKVCLKAGLAGYKPCEVFPGDVSRGEPPASLRRGPAPCLENSFTELRTHAVEIGAIEQLGGNQAVRSNHCNIYILLNEPISP
jgi:hypothetical protein